MSQKTCNGLERLKSCWMSMCKTWHQSFHVLCLSHVSILKRWSSNKLNKLLQMAKQLVAGLTRIIKDLYMVVDQNSFLPERPFFANKNFTFAKLSRTPCLSFAGPMLANNTSYEDSFTTCQITPENHGSLLGSLLNMQLASRNPFSGQILLC